MNNICSGIPRKLPTIGGEDSSQAGNTYAEIFVLLLTKASTVLRMRSLFGFLMFPKHALSLILFILTSFNFIDYLNKLHTLHSSAKLHFLIFVLVAFQLCMSKI